MQLARAEFCHFQRCFCFLLGRSCHLHRCLFVCVCDRRKSIGIKKPMKQPDVACVTVDPLDGADFPPCASNNDDVPSVLSSIPQTSAPPSGKDVDATAASCPVPADREDDDNKMEAQCTLPSDLPSGLNAAILDLKQVSFSRQKLSAFLLQMITSSLTNGRFFSEITQSFF